MGAASPYTLVEVEGPDIPAHGRGARVMATAELQRISPSAEQHLLLEDVSWEFYERFLDELERTGNRGVRLTFDEGLLEIMSPASSEHEHPKTLIGRMVETLTEELNIPIWSAGSLLIKLKRLKKGLQPDESYYVQNEAVIRARGKFNPQRDPPPDLVVEVEITSYLLNRIRIYAAFKVPEIWRCRKGRIGFHLLRENGSYVESDHSRSFPFLAAADLNRFLEATSDTDETSWIRSFRRWVGKHFAEHRRR
jgi:Uma2 family endonuclease